MKPLYLSGFGISLSVNRARLQVKDGFQDLDIEPERFEFQPRHAKFDSVIIDGHSGCLSLDSVKWLARHNIAIFVLDFNGTILTSMLPREPVNGPLKLAQLTTYNDSQKRLLIAKKLIEAKGQRTLDVLSWLEARYRNLVELATANIALETERITKTDSLPRLMLVEGRIADIYWNCLQKIIPSKFSFKSRTHETHQMNSADQVNTLLNYSYAILESACRKALNSVGLELTIGFLHETRQTKHSLAYDLMEPYRFLIDTTIIECLEFDRFSKKDFYRLDNYVLRLRPEAVKKLLNALRIKFNSTVQYRDKHYSWDTIIGLKAQELAAFILGKNSALTFEEPRPELRDESAAVRQAILSMSVAEARKRGIRKNTLWYMQQRARTHKPLRLYNRVKTKLPCTSS